MPGQTVHSRATRGPVMSGHTSRSREECDVIIAAFVKLKRALPELERRNRFAAGNDGYPAGTLGGGGGQSGVVSQPTERAALSRREPDPVRNATKNAIGSLREALELARSVENALALAGIYETAPACAGCGRGDAQRLVDGRCDACRMRARRNGGVS